MYIPAEVLQSAGFDPTDPQPYYRTWATSKGGVMIRLYKEP